ncbi:efflux RND transporter periplasmic adaptor subunit [Ideonella sp. B508-1]|uniref:efflux RND transporter periplasmic adaptor subunit n=1 Tax=Ideonella sp. B508-1 TaxID=137716 RepID=UPI00034C3113|nr:efflux RND transporter periplasmic adaptor subunit [Ideonella sp. B508-1]
MSIGPVMRRDIRVIVPAIGNIAADNTAVVHAKVSGELKALYFHEGQSVRGGQLLAQIDPASYQIALDQAQANQAKDEAQLRNARLDLARYKDLVARQAAPQQQLDTQDALVRQLEAAVQTDQAAVRNAQLQLSYTRVVAPISGLAGLKQADLGNLVTPSDANGLVSIAQVQPVNMVFAIPQQQLPTVRSHLAAGQALRVEAWDTDNTHLLAQGSVASTDNAIDTTTGTVKLKALFPNQDLQLFPNQFVNVRLQLGTLAAATAVPAAAIQQGTHGAYVYEVVAPDAVRLQAVKVLATEGDWSAVEGGIHPGQQVVVDGMDRLRDGAKIQVITPAGDGDAGASRPGGGHHAWAGGAGHAASAASHAWAGSAPAP